MPLKNVEGSKGNGGEGRAREGGTSDIVRDMKWEARATTGGVQDMGFCLMGD